MSSLRYKILFVFISFFLFITLACNLIAIFADISEVQDALPFIYLLCITLFGFSFPILLAWIAGLFWFSIICSSLSVILCLLTMVKTELSSFLLFGSYYIGLSLFLVWRNKVKKERIMLNAIEIEKDIEEKNILEKAFSDKSQALETFLHTIADYSRLRDIIDEFSSTLSQDKACTLIVKRTLDIIGKGELVLLYLVDLNENSLSLVASESIDRKKRKRIKRGDVFDQWVIKYKQQLLIEDITKDVRFDTHLMNTGDEFKSVMVTPLIYESRVVGTLRINSEKDHAFTNDDLRVLSIIGSLASAALSNAFLYKKTEELAIKDSLTGLFVYRYFKQRLKEEHKRALLTNAPLSLLMGDLDNFKTYNDRYGHAAGDIILTGVGTIIRSIIKENGIVARYGGEEFAVLMPHTPKNEAFQYAEEIRRSIEETVFELRSVHTKITISIGVANIPQNTLDAQELIKQADTRLYDAKRKGKNCVLG